MCLAPAGAVQGAADSAQVSRTASEENMRLSRWPVARLAALTLAGSACVVSRGVKVEPLNTQEPVAVQSPVKAHLKDGSTVVFGKGVTVERSKLRGEGTRYDLTLQRSEAVHEVALEEVMAVESFRTDVNTGASVGLSLLGTAAGLYASAALAVAIFGSCPTVYSDAGRGARLEAELFSYSIVPLFEARDLDRLSLRESADGTLRLEVRDE